MTLARRWLLFRSMLRKELLLLRRYPAELLGQFVFVYVLFLLIFFGGRSVAPAFVEGSKEALIVGYVLWSVVIGAYSGFAEGIVDEAEWGTLEQIAMSPFGFPSTVLTYALARITTGLAFSSLLFVGILLTTRSWIPLDPLSTVPIVAFAVMPALGVGFAIGGLALVYKRLSSLFMVLQFAFAAFLAAPVETHPVLKLLPSAQGSYLLRRSVTDGLALWAAPPVEVAVLVLVGLGYLAAGYATFRFFEKRARNRGVLGHY